MFKARWIRSDLKDKFGDPLLRVTISRPKFTQVPKIWRFRQPFFYRVWKTFGRIENNWGIMRIERISERKPFFVGHSFGFEDPNLQRIVRTPHVFLARLNRLPQTISHKNKNNWTTMAKRRDERVGWLFGIVPKVMEMISWLQLKEKSPWYFASCWASDATQCQRQRQRQGQRKR